MELKTLWLGLFISLAAFAVKTGLGWAYLWAAAPLGSHGRNRRATATAAVALLYALVFAGVYKLAVSLNPLAHYELFEPLWRRGLALHWLTAVLLFAWGLILLRRGADEGACQERRSHRRRRAGG